MALDTFNPYLFVSSGEQSNKFLTPTYADGIAKFQAQRAQSLTGLTVQINPIQEGTGDPSPDNIRPISGRTGLTVTRAGRNICPVEKQPIIEALWGSDVRGMVAFLNTLKAGTYTLSNKYRIVTAPTSGNGVQHGALYVTAIINGAQTPVNTYRTVTDTSPSVGKVYQESTTFTITDAIAGNINHCFVYCDNTTHTGTGRGTYECYDIQLEVGNTASAYEPYKGETYPITWQTEARTVYGGTLDVVSGVLTVTDAQIASYAGETLQGEWISDRDVYVAGTTPTTGAQVVYKLATPQTYQLSPTDVKTLAGFNQIYSDAGPVIDIKF